MDGVVGMVVLANYQKSKLGGTVACLE